MNKLFDLADVLSITTGRLVSPRHMAGVYEIIDFFFGPNPPAAAGLLSP